jgi:hydroxymethylpyrimidine/phosphomethylpyrimidine kinase
MPETRPIVLSISGYDPSSGAGVTADIKTMAAHGCYGVTCITALTVQNTQGVSRVLPVSAKTLTETLAVLSSDVQLSAVKVGMLGSAEVAEALADFLETRRLRNVVLDPVIRSSSGAELLGKEGVTILRDRLIRLVDVITPNIDEACELSGMPVSDLAGMQNAAAALHELGARAVVVTGGHLKDPVDLLSLNGKFIKCKGKKIQSKSTHGTGCAFATALACNLARACDLRDSVDAAGQYVRRAIERAYRVGKGNGPIHHLYAMREA